MSDKKWKSNLLSSSLPLEYEVARTLVTKGFAVEADYTYGRDAESGQPKDFSVDMLARGFPPFTKPNTVDGTLELLIECKHRVRGTKWLFLPDVNKDKFSHIYLGCALRVFDDFSPYIVNKNPSYEFTHKTPCCYKGIEVQQADRVYDAEIKHGIEQLRYAFPRLISNAILNNIMGHPEDNRPFLICPILLTTAELLVLDKKLTIDYVEAADDLTALGKPVPYLITYSGYGPDFENHCTKMCKVLTDYVGHNLVRKVDDIRGVISDGRYRRQGPIAFMKELAAADDTALQLYFTQFVVCTKDGFAKLVDKLKRWSVQILDSRTDMREVAQGKESSDRQDRSS